MAKKATQQVRVNTTRYLDEDGLEALWEKIKEYVAENGGSGNASIHIGDEPPTDENCNLWIDTSGETLYTGEDVEVIVANVLGGIENGTY